MSYYAYSFKNTTTGLFYIGITDDPEAGKEEFETQLKNGNFHSTSMQADHNEDTKYKLTYYKCDTLEEAWKKRGEMRNKHRKSPKLVNNPIKGPTGHDWTRPELEHTENFVAAFLTASYIYYLHPSARPITTDAVFDWCCKRLIAQWDTIIHPHKHLIKLDDLEAGTGFALREHDYPRIVVSVASRMSLQRDNK